MAIDVVHEKRFAGSTKEIVTPLTKHAIHHEGIFRSISIFHAITPTLFQKSRETTKIKGE